MKTDAARPNARKRDLAAREGAHYAAPPATDVSPAPGDEIPDLPIPTQAHPPEAARMTPEIFAVLLVAIILSNIGEVLLKIGVDKVETITFEPQTLIRALLQWQVLAGFAMLFGGSLFWLAVISRTNLSIAYPLLAVGYVLVALWAFFVLKEPMSPTRWLGIGAIVGGVALVLYKV